MPRRTTANSGHESSQEEEHSHYTLSEVVTILVSPKRKAFYIHRDLLCQNSPYLRAVLSEPDKNNYSSAIFWPKDDPKTVELMSDWMYRGSLDRKTFQPNVSQHVLVQVFQLAHQKMLPDSHNTMMDTWRNNLHNEDEYPYPNTLGLIYRWDLRETPLHTFVLKKIVYCMMTYKKQWQAGLQKFEDLYTECGGEGFLPKTCSGRSWRTRTNLIQIQPANEAATFIYIQTEVHATSEALKDWFFWSYTLLRTEKAQFTHMVVTWNVGKPDTSNEAMKEWRPTSIGTDKINMQLKWQKSIKEPGPIL